MKISCQSCQAKYTIADEKVLGKIVKIRCKKCGATIVINGNETAAAPSPSEEQASNVFDYTAQGATGGEQWTVNVADGDQRTMTSQEIALEFKVGAVNEETFCWKDGMSDWLPLREIDELYAACTMGPTPSLSPEGQSHHDAMGDMHDQAPVAAPQDAGGGFLFGAGAPSAPSSSPSASPNGNGAGLFGGSTEAAARRQGGRRGGGADLFGGVAQAGGEDDVMTSAPQGMPVPSSDPGKMTGQRNENSVLFSLNALTNTAPKEEAPPPIGEGSGLIDIRALSAMGTSAPAKTNHVDDIMNLGGGGAFSAALAAPVLAPPQMDTGSIDAGGSGGKTNRTMMFAAIGAVALLLLVVVLVFALKKPDEPVAAAPVATQMATAPIETAPPPAATVAAADTAVAPSIAAAPGTGQATAPKAPSAGGGGGGSRAVPHSAGGGGGGTASNDSPAPAAIPAPAAPPAAKPSFADAIKSAAGDTGGGAAAAAPSGAGSAPFDRGAAAAALSAVNVVSCKKPDGPTGSGHVKVTFAPNGTVSSAVVDQPPFAGTPVGGCVAGKFRGAHIPAFSGGPVPVGKSFVIN
jgi:predicted Zn finger-like uncharacterized protein